MAADPRIDRLRASVLAFPTAALRDAVRGVPEPTVRALPGTARPLVAQLKRAGDPAALLRRMPDLTVVGLLADVLSDDCLHATRDHLGDAADDPTREQLVAAVDAVLADFDVATVRVMLATVAVGEAEASDLCDALLVDDERFAVEAAPAPASRATARTPKPAASDEVKERRRQRKEAERDRKAREKAKTAPARPKRTRATTEPAPEVPAPVPAPVTTRRAAVLTPQQARRFDPAHPLVGTVVLAEVRFDDVDPEQPHVDRKHRPCVVIGVAQHSLLVRPGYSDGGVQSRRWESHQLRDWKEAGLDRASWIEAKPHVVPRRTAEHEFGRLSDDDWNALW